MSGSRRGKRHRQSLTAHRQLVITHTAIDTDRISSNKVSRYGLYPIRTSYVGRLDSTPQSSHTPYSRRGALIYRIPRAQRVIQVVTCRTSMRAIDSTYVSHLESVRIVSSLRAGVPRADWCSDTISGEVPETNGSTDTSEIRSRTTSMTSSMFNVMTSRK